MAEIMALLLFVGLIIGLMTGHAIAFVLGGVALIFGLIGWGPQTVNIFVNGIYATMNNYTLVAIPLFTFMANLLGSSKIAEGLFESLRYVLGGLRGGIALAIVVVSTVFAATTGVVGASVLTMGVLGIPVLMKYGYDKRLSTGVIAAGGTLGILIPPSIMLIVMGAQAQVSVGSLFKSTIIPGLILAFFYGLYVLYICWKNPEYGPALTKEEIKAVPFKDRVFGILKNLVPPLILIMAVLGTIYTGIATPTEAAGVGAFVALIMTICYRKFSFKMLSEAVYDTAKTTAMVLIIMVGATAFSSMFLGLNGAKVIESFVESMGFGQWETLIFMLIIVFILGMFIDWVGIVMIIFPVFMPILKTYSFDMVWLVTIIALLLQTSFLTPPFGHSLFYTKGVVKDSIPMSDIYKGVVPFIIIIIIVLVLTMIFPGIALWLPSVFS
ncbi:C4-dicarboxylate ABC transporter [Ureibacillus massiliensis 4400831 = CIP 108448 = CCUG 49529]|uniref:C4-dicarboxylate ABC transporter n=1 Tax=Ureibacillus massiliensis 4400831 = CIP 108448 = CCUG 49529 TaxID=1211035 RepID=A0A0A3IZF0_9BACL|nr:TRAP transporter large permease subunit [Ureibacillus massiliensis]KGR90159.1 C4-dicarboxylate ABC transporter [Ureibacillus massiliensis 4400831 = CIP 108448 = CCUG 49529]